MGKRYWRRGQSGSNKWGRGIGGEARVALTNGEEVVEERPEGP